MRSHLEACAECRERFASLEETVLALRGLPVEADAPQAIWRGIEERIAAGRGEQSLGGTTVLPLRVTSRGARRFSLSIPQLAAAAVVVSLLSGTLVWQGLSRGRPGPALAPVAGARPGGPSARAVAMGETGYEEAVAELQTIIDEGRDVLSPETLSTLEASLRTIDNAIADVRVALESDPSNELLSRLLTNHQRSKLRVLRQAAISVRPRT